MADILSLSRLRKTRARAAEAAQAAENRAKFGRTKAEKQREATEPTLRDRPRPTSGKISAAAPLLSPPHPQPVIPGAAQPRPRGPIRYTASHSTGWAPRSPLSRR